MYEFSHFVSASSVYEWSFCLHWLHYTDYPEDELSVQINVGNRVDTHIIPAHVYYQPAHVAQWLTHSGAMCSGT